MKFELTQNDIFLNYEGDHWYERNREVLFPDRTDHIVPVIEELDVQPCAILEVGCSNGYRLEKLRQIFHADCYGIDASSKAVSEGRILFPDLCLKKADISDFSPKKVRSCDN